MLTIYRADESPTNSKLACLLGTYKSEIRAHTDRCRFSKITKVPQRISWHNRFHQCFERSSFVKAEEWIQSSAGIVFREATQWLSSQSFIRVKDILNMPHLTKQQSIVTLNQLKTTEQWRKITSYSIMCNNDVKSGVNRTNLTKFYKIAAKF